MATKESLHRTLNKLAKWRTLFAGWQLGTRPDSDPECQAVRDHRDLSLMARIDINALLALLIRKGVFTEQEWIDALPSFERMAPVTLSVVCFRVHPAGIDNEMVLDVLNEKILNRINAAGTTFFPIPVCMESLLCA